MKIYKLLILSPIIFSTTLLSSCGNQAASDVDDICDCFLEEGVEDEDDLMELNYDQKKLKKIAKCALPILEDVKDEIDDMDDEERAQYFGDVIKAAVDCECGYKILEIAAELYDKEDIDDEFGDMIEDLERVVEHSSGNHYYYGEETKTEESTEYKTEEAYCGDGDYYEGCGDGDYYEVEEEEGEVVDYYNNTSLYSPDDIAYTWLINIANDEGYLTQTKWDYNGYFDGYGTTQVTKIYYTKEIYNDGQTAEVEIKYDSYDYANGNSFELTQLVYFNYYGSKEGWKWYEKTNVVSPKNI